MRYLKIIVGVLVIIVGVIFVLQNHDLQRPIKLGFDPLYMFRSQEAAPPPPPPAPVQEEETAPKESGEKETPAPQGETAGTDTPGTAEEDSTGIPAFILIFIAFFAGILVASLFGIMEKFRLKRVVKNSAARVRELEEELKKLRNLPLTQPTTQPILAPPPSPAEPLENGTEPSPPEDEENEKED